MKLLLPLLLACLQLSPSISHAELSAETLQRAQKELSSICYDVFSVSKTDKTTSGKGYKSLSGYHKVFVIGESAEGQVCYFDTTGYLMASTFDQLIKSTLAACNKAISLGRSCEIYAEDDNIVYISTEQKIIDAKKSYEAKDYIKAFNLLTSISTKGVETIDKAIASDFEYMLGNTLVKIDKESNGFVAINHFNKSWHYFNNPQAALEEANLRIASDQLSYNWEVIRLAYEHYFKNASAESKLANAEAINNYKLTESYYQASLDDIRKNEEELAANEKAAVEQAKLDLQAAELAAKNAERDARKTEREAKRLAETQKKEEAKLAKQAADAIKSRDDKTCRSYGAAVGSQAYVMCRIELAKKEKSSPVAVQSNEASDSTAEMLQLEAETLKQLQARQSEYAEHQRQYEEQLRQSEARRAAQVAKEQDSNLGNALINLGLGMAGVSSRQIPAPDNNVQTHHYNINGRIMTCTTIGGLTTCN